MNFTGKIIREIRTEWDKTLREVSESIGVSIDYLSKIEKGQRKPTPHLLKSISKYYDISEDSLLEFYYSDEILELFDTYDGKERVLKLVKRRLNNPDTEIGESNGKQFKVTNQLKSKRKYVKGGRYGKVKGFNFYIQKNDRLTKKDRRELIRKSEDYFQTVIHQYGKRKIPSDLPSELDPTFTDLEMMEIWNDFYDNYGSRFPEFRKQIERESLREFSDKEKPSSTPPNLTEVTDQVKQFKNRFRNKRSNQVNLG